MIFVYNAVIVSTSVAGVFEFALVVWTLRVRGIIPIKAGGMICGCGSSGRSVSCMLGCTNYWNTFWQCLRKGQNPHCYVYCTPVVKSQGRGLLSEMSIIKNPTTFLAYLGHLYYEVLISEEVWCALWLRVMDNCHENTKTLHPLSDNGNLLNFMAADWLVTGKMFRDSSRSGDSSPISPNRLL